MSALRKSLGDFSARLQKPLIAWSEMTPLVQAVALIAVCVDNTLCALPNQLALQETGLITSRGVSRGVQRCGLMNMR